MNRLFEGSLSRGRLEDGSLDSAGWVPLADVYETSDTFVVLVELPGLNQDDIEVTIDGDQLTLRGERRLSDPTRPESFHRIERSYGAFARTFHFTGEVDPSRVTAQFRDGLLRLELIKLRPSTHWRLRGERNE